MAILNYTTKIPVSSTTAEIQKILTKAGAGAIMSEFDAQGNASSMSFRVDKDGVPIFFKLPVDVEGVTRALKRDRVYRDNDHARRVAWRILKDWIEAQMAIIYAGMAELPQVFLPYAQTSSGETVYERMQQSEFKLLQGPK